MCAWRGNVSSWEIAAPSSSFTQREDAAREFRKNDFGCKPQGTRRLLGWQSSAATSPAIRVRVSRESSQTAQQGARANADICHAACDLISFEAKLRSSDRDEARGAPDAVVAHL
jgi:hypothetical protein